MASVFRKFTTRPMPSGAEVVERRGTRLARWRGKSGKLKTAPLTADGARIKVESATFYVKLRDGQGVVRVVKTGCRSEDGAGARHGLQSQGRAC